MKLPDDERILIVRPCLKAICLNIRPAAKLLSLLLFYARNCGEQEATYTFSCTQEDLIEGLIDEMDVKTLHRMAIPMLRLLGYLDVDGSSYRYQYTIHLDLIQHVLLHYKDRKQLDKLLIVSMKEQLDKCLIQIDKCPIELVKCPIELDKLLIPFRQMSNSKRGRKPRPQEAGEAQFSDTQNLSDTTDVITDNRECIASASASATLPPFENGSHYFENDNHSYSTPAIASSAVTTRNEEGDTHGTDNTHSSASYPHSREPGVDLTPARNGSQADHLACTAEQRPPRDSRQEQEIASQEGDTPHGRPNATLVDLVGDLQWTRLPGQPDRSTQTTQVTPQEGAPDHAQPLQPLPTANHPHRGSGDVPSRDSQVNSTGFTSPLDAPPVDRAQGSDADGGEGRAGVGEDTARGIGSRSPGEADATGDTARGQVTEGDDHAHLPPGSAFWAAPLPGAGGDSHDAAVDDRHVATPETGPDVATGQEEIDTLGRAWQSVDPEQIAPREDVSVVAASPLDTSTVEPGESGEGTLPVAPVTGQEDVKTARSRQSKVKPIPEGPPVMPAEEAPWCAETIVQICEARRGRRYPNGAKRKSDRERDVQLEYAKQLAEMPDIDREKLLKAASHQETRHDNWWMDTNGYITPRQLVEKDRIHNMLDELMRLERKKNLKVVPQSGSTNGISKPTNEPTTNIRELVRQREAARAAQVQ